MPSGTPPVGEGSGGSSLQDLLEDIAGPLDEYLSDGHDGKCVCHEAIICPDEGGA